MVYLFSTPKFLFHDLDTKFYIFSSPRPSIHVCYCNNLEKN
jgi:hypothetical protein